MQAGFRRFLVEDARELLGIGPLMPSPPVVVALFFCRRALRPERIDMVSEAIMIAPMICGREHDLTLGPIATAYERYAPFLEPGDPILTMLQERFNEVLVLAEADAFKRVSTVAWPSEGREMLAKVRRDWGAPERPLGGDVDSKPLFANVDALWKDLQAMAEATLRAQLSDCQTTAGLTAMTEAVDRELGSVHTTLRAHVRTARLAYREHLKEGVESGFGCPPVGNLAILSSAGRWFAHEMGHDHPTVEDFMAEVKRLQKKAVKEVVTELTPLVERVQSVRKLLNTDPPPPRLMADDYDEELRDALAEAIVAFERRWEELGTESKALLGLARTLLLPGPFVALMAKTSEAAAVVLRRPMPPTCPGTSAEEGEARLAAAVRIAQLLAWLRAGDTSLAIALQAEFRSELEWARPFVAFLEEPAVALDQERPVAGKSLQVAAPRKMQARTLPLAELFADPEADIKVCLRLHGVTMEDTEHLNEILLNEQFKAVIAKECGIPGEWITHVALARPAARQQVGTGDHGTEEVPVEAMAARLGKTEHLGGTFASVAAM